MKDDLDQAILEVLDSGAYINGPQVKQFEDNIASYLQVKNAIGVASGSDALLLSLHALGITQEDKVIVPTFTFFATPGAVSRLGAVPVFVDIDKDSYNLDLYQVEQLARNDTKIKAIIPVHLFGLSCNMQKLMDIAEQLNLYVVEDACQAIDSDSSFSIDGSSFTKKSGTIGDTGCFSFFPSKNLGCFGDGGMIVTNNDLLADKLRILRVHGAQPKYYHKVVGYNSRLDTIQAAVLNVKLRFLNDFTQKRREVAAKYNLSFEMAGLGEFVRWPNITPGHVFNQYVIEVDRRNDLISFLSSKGISSAVYYPLPLHLQDCFNYLGYKWGSFPRAEEASKRVLALPIDPELTTQQIDYIVQQIKEFFSV